MDGSWTADQDAPSYNTTAAKASEMLSWGDGWPFWVPRPSPLRCSIEIRGRGGVSELSSFRTSQLRTLLNQKF